MTDALEDHEDAFTVRGRTIINLRFADYIDGFAGEDEELAILVQRQSLHSLRKKTKLITNNTSGINKEINVNGQKIETVIKFKYLGSVVSDEGSKPEILSRIAQTTEALTRLKHFGMTGALFSVPRYH